MTRGLLGALAALLALFGASCGGAETGAVVHFLSQRQIPGQAQSLEVAVLGAQDGKELSRRSYDLAPIARFPATLGLVQGDETPARVRVEGKVLVGTAVVAAGSAEMEFAAARLVRVDVSLIDQ